MSARIRIVLIAAVCAAPLFTGCSTWRKKPKETTAISAQTEQSFKERWLEKRGAELIGQGLAPEVARNHAVQEFRQLYEYTGAAKE